MTNKIRKNIGEQEKEFAKDILNILRARRIALEDKVEGWLAAAGGFFGVSSVMATFAGHPVIAGFVGLVLLAAGWLRIIYFRTKIIWIEEAALVLNRALHDKEVEPQKWDALIEEMDGCARAEFRKGLYACPYTALTMTTLMLGQLAVLIGSIF